MRGLRINVDLPWPAQSIRPFIALLGNFHVVDLHVRGININIHGEAKWLSLFLSSSPAAFHVCRTKSDRVGLEVQASWFGELRKSPFFKTSV